ncbi:type I 3-dehydroquinate dehydratase [Salipaludibacillus sp. LMS25]|uniref:type I 3-dehydroquinate dehydratase n=1 Tax=Salipaludibacillus sp. LMS25 TaxID=2924031 RepID=UPI0020D01606|nr:type I 3-dehydroquinate dehydratase [Salipaludibacillus sp. LMS25]UTR13585.1 type I 3-dehydroquinate dehydratase [Salipaludibacillus sp. LMS25]
MKNVIQVKNIKIGEGIPKICVSMVGRTTEELIEEASYLQELEADIVEWRADFYDHVEDMQVVKETLAELRFILEEKPLVFTFRSLKEGGKKQVSPSYYVALNKAVVETRLVDLIDVELFNDEKDVATLIKAAHAHNIRVIISNHDFDKTPPKEDIISRLRRAQELGGDLPKIAVMPNSSADVLTLLDATVTMNEKYADRPIITMAMAGKGVVSRLSGEIFGSAVTFGAVKTASAPGQVAINELRQTLNVIHRHL